MKFTEELDQGLFSSFILAGYCDYLNKQIELQEKAMMRSDIEEVLKRLNDEWEKADALWSKICNSLTSEVNPE